MTTKIIFVFIILLVFPLIISLLAIISISHQAGLVPFKAVYLFSNRTMLVILALDVINLGVGLTLLLITAKSMGKPLQQLANSMAKLAVGDQNRNSTTRITEAITGRKDEVGAIGRAFIGISDYMIGAVDAANKICSGDLSIDVKPYSEKDELGNAFKEMTIYLDESVKTIAQQAAIVNISSNQLAQAASEAGEVTEQIVASVQQVSQGAVNQNASIETTFFVVEQMVHSIEEISRGAEEQAGATNKAAGITAQLSLAIEQVSKNAQAVVQEANAAAKAARLGTDKVQLTLDGMREIKQTVDLSAQKVQILGQRSDQIGEIVNTIDEIASQTNLLALNAAIEAARAGESGKGFAVVADEVRKLAERASAATKEIGNLIQSIQVVVAESVSAMEHGVNEVEKGVDIASEAGITLEDILRSTEEVNRQAEQSASAAVQMSASANELVSAVEMVSAVVEENTASTTQMSAGSNEVSQSIEKIAAVAEENSAAVDEVSDSTNKMSAHVDEFGKSAKALAVLARHLEEVVQRFKLK